jgi:hypothetical protein
MNNTPHFLGLSAEDIAELETATQLRVVDEPDWSTQEYDRVIAYLRAKAAKRTSVQAPTRCACPKRPHGPLRDVAYVRPSMH